MPGQETGDEGKETLNVNILASLPGFGNDYAVTVVFLVVFCAYALTR